jgi:hypothetical protein
MAITTEGGAILVIGSFGIPTREIGQGPNLIRRAFAKRLMSMTTIRNDLEH